MSYPAWDDCDAVAPDTVTDVTVQTGRTSATMTWTAPGDDGNCGTAVEYDLRYSTSPITEGNYYSATRGPSGITAGPPGTIHCAELGSLTPSTWYYFALKTRDDRYNWAAISNVVAARTKSNYTEVVCQGGEGLLAQGWDEGGWSPENSLLSAVAGSQADLYQLQGAAGAEGGTYQVRLVMTGSGRAELDEVRLWSVDRDPSVRAVAGLDRAYLGTTEAVARVTDAGGADVTSQVSGSSDHPFAGDAGASLTVDLGGKTGTNTALVIDWAGATRGAAADSTGIVVQKPASGGAWLTIAHLRPRRTFDRVAVDAEGSATVRLLFLGDHQVRRLERMSVTATVNPSWLSLASARHSRLGNVTSAVASTGGATTALLAGDHLTLSYGETAVAAGQVRELVLFARGGYTTRGSEARRGGTLEPVSVAGYETALGAAQPNPGSGGIRIGYTLARGAEVVLSLYDVAGRRVRTLERGRRLAGTHEAVWDGRGDDGAPMQPGVYLYRMTTDGWASQRKLVIYAR